MTALFLLNFFLIGCAAKKLAIENADTLIAHQVQKKIPLSSIQRKLFDKDLTKFLNDTKPMFQEMLPAIDGIDLKKIESLGQTYPKFELFFKNLFQNFSFLLSNYMAKLDEKQQKEFFETMEEDHKEILKKSDAKHLTKLQERFEVFLGELTKEQIAILKEYTSYFELRTKLRIKNRKMLHEEFRKIYLLPLESGKREELFRQAFVHYQTESFKENKNLEILQKLWPTFTSKQMVHFKSQTQEITELINYYIKMKY